MRHVIDRPVTISMVALALVLIGAVAAWRLPLAFMPQGTGFPGMSVMISLPASSPVEAERTYTDPLERELKTINGLNRLRTSTSQNSIRVALIFERGANIDEAYMEVRDRLERARTFLPPNLGTIPIFRWRDNGTDMFLMARITDPEISDPGYLLQRKLKPWLERLPGMAKVEISWPEKELKISFHQDRLSRFNINISTVIDLINEARSLKHIGILRHGENQLSVQVPATLREPDSWSNLVIRPGIRLKDLADVELATPPLKREIRWNGARIANIDVFKKEGVSAVTLSDTVLAAVANPPKELEGITIEPIFDKGAEIKKSINNLIISGLMGAAFAFIVLYFFLHRLDLAVVASISVPLSLLAAMAHLYFTGGTLNMMSLIGFLMAIGMLVDNSVVVIEQIDFRIHTEKNPVTAVYMAMQEIMQPLIIATLTTMVVLLPLLFLDMGLVTIYVRAIAVPLCVSLFASLIIATTLTPLLSRFVMKRKKREWAMFKAFERLVKGFTSGYLFATRKALTHRALLMFFLIAFIVLTTIPAGKMEFGLKGGDRSTVEVDYRLPPSTTMEEARAFAIEVEAILIPKKDYLRARGINTRILSATDVRFDIWLDFNKFPDADRKAQALAILELLPDIPPGAQRSINDQSSQNEDEPDAAITLLGRSPDAVFAYAEELRWLLLSDPRVIGVDTGENSYTDEVRLHLRREQITRVGMSSGQAAREMQSYFQERSMSRVITPQREYEIKIARGDTENQTIQDISLLPLGDNPSAAPFVDWSLDRGLSTITKRDGRMEVDVVAFTDFETGREASKFIADFAKNLTPPAGVTVSAGRTRFFRTQDQTDVLAGVIATFICVYILMAFLYESLTAPFAVIVAVPISFVGAIWLVFFKGIEMNAMGTLAFILLIGVVVNNAVLLVNRTMESLREGNDFTKASLTAVEERLRPIMMASLTTILGLTPLALGDANMLGMKYAPLGLVFAGGLALSTLLVPLYVPVLLSLLLDLKVYLADCITSFTSIKRKNSEPKSAAGIT